MTTGRHVVIRGLSDDATCDVHGWPTAGMGKRLVDEMRRTHPRGVNACRECIERARDDAAQKRASR